MTDFPKGHRVIAVGQPSHRPAYDDLPARDVFSFTRMLNPYRMQHSYSPTIPTRDGVSTCTGDHMLVKRLQRR